jgi:ketosteroid isomerase-like protein
MDGSTLARRYYECIDDDTYDELAALLDPEFVHERPDRTFEGRDRFVRFMAEERPDPDTTHEVGAVYRAEGAGEDGNERGGERAATVAVEGRLHRASGEVLFGFVDTFRFEGGAIASIRTYTR